MRADSRRNSQNPFLAKVGPYLPVLIVSLFVGMVLWGIAPGVLSSIKGTLSSALQVTSDSGEDAAMTIPEIQEALDDDTITKEEREELLTQLGKILVDLENEHSENGVPASEEEIGALIREFAGMAGALEELTQRNDITDEEKIVIAAFIPRIEVIASTFSAGLDSAADDNVISEEVEPLISEIEARVERMRQTYNWLDAP